MIGGRSKVAGITCKMFLGVSSVGAPSAAPLAAFLAISVLVAATASGLSFALATEAQDLDVVEPHARAAEADPWDKSAAAHARITLTDAAAYGQIRMDQKIFTWTDKVHITVVAPDYNFDRHMIDTIGSTRHDAVKISTREASLKNYKLVETGPNTGIFTGEVILIGFDHDADGNPRTGAAGGYDNPQRKSGGDGPTSGYLAADSDDAITVSFGYSEDQTVVGTALIRWNVGEIQWSDSSYPIDGAGLVRVVDPDMNLNPEAVNSFEIDVWSDSDPGGVSITVIETHEASGIFEGSVVFSADRDSSGHRLRVGEGDTITAEYEDNTLPSPHSTADELNVVTESMIGVSLPPLERVDISNLAMVGLSGKALGGGLVAGQQAQVTAALTNEQTKHQQFAYLIQVQNEAGVTVSLSWVTGSLLGGQTLSTGTSWMPDKSGTYKITAFVWESIRQPAALSPPAVITVTVN